MFLRSVDLEARALFVPGGLFGSVRDTFGRRPAMFAASALLIGDLALSALAAAVAGHYAFAVAGALASSQLAGIASDTAARTIAIALVAVVWGVQRQGRSPSDLRVARAVGFAMAAIGVLVVWGTATLGVRHPPLALLPLPSAVNILWFAVALGYALPCLGGLDALGHAALDLEQPRIRNLLRVARLVGAYTLFITAVTAFLVVGLVPADQQVTSMPAPLAGVAMAVAGPAWLRFTLLLLVAAAAVVFLASTVRAASKDGNGNLARLVEEGVFGQEFRTLHHRFGTPWRIIDATAVAQFVFLLVSDGDVVWLARMYAFAVVGAALFKIAALVRYRSHRREKRAYRVPLTLTVR